MLAPGEQEEQDPERVLVRFGDAPGNALSLSVVQSMLRAWHQREPETMGAYIAEAITGSKPRTSLRRSRAQ